MNNNTTFQKKYGPWAIVTGASAGIGEEFARQLAAQGLNLVLVARRESKLRDLAEHLTLRYGVEARVAVADLTQPDFMDAIRPALADLDIGLLVNNAGVYTMGEFLDNTIDKELSILDVNTRAPLILTHEIGQQMRNKGRGGIIFVSSMGGYQGAPYIANYAGTKAYDLIFGEALWYELKRYGVDVLTVSPGGTQTEGYYVMAQIVGGADKLPAVDPVAPVVTEALEALGRKISVIPGAKNRLMNFMMTRLLPRKASTNMLGSMMGRAFEA